jgi:hypothetical protein
MKKTASTVALGALVVCAMAPAWAVYKCTAPDGKVSYQTQACPFTGTGAVLNPGRRVVVVPDPETFSPIKAQNQSDSFAPVPVATVAPTGNPLDAEAQTCLAFIQPMLKDPGSPSVRDVRKEGTVLAMTVYAKNSYGGTTSKAAACEIKNGLLDVGWTNIHLKRLGWFAG